MEGPRRGNRGDSRGDPSPNLPERHALPAAAHASGAFADVSQAPREQLALGLAGALEGALRVRDLGAARVAHEALGKLLGPSGEPAEVVELAERRKVAGAVQATHYEIANAEGLHRTTEASPGIWPPPAATSNGHDPASGHPSTPVAVQPVAVVEQLELVFAAPPAPALVPDVVRDLKPANILLGPGLRRARTPEPLPPEVDELVASAARRSP